MLALSLSDKFCYFGIFVFVFVFDFFVFVFNRFLFFRFSFVFVFIIFSFSFSLTKITLTQCTTTIATIISHSWLRQWADETAYLGKCHLGFAGSSRE